MLLLSALLSISFALVCLCSGQALNVKGPFSSQVGSTSRQCCLRFLESNSWNICLNDINFYIDPVMDQLDFGIPTLYAGNKRIVDGNKEISNIAGKSDFILISQGFDDHAHIPTLNRLSRLNSNLSYICPPSARKILTKCGIPANKITALLPGQTHTFVKGKSAIRIRATTGALLGPPWQQKENGYIISSPSSNDAPSLYYEPHCMFDEEELKDLQADVVITPVVSQELPAFTLVAGGLKALRLASLLKAKYVVPMANGNLEQTGVLSRIIRAEGTESSFKSLVQKWNKANVGARRALSVVSAPPGEMIMLSAP